MNYIAGIDGGGTKTTLICQDLKGEELLTKRFGAFNINSIGEKAFRALLVEIADTLKSVGNCISLCIGAAGISNNEMVKIVDEVILSRGIKYQLVGDHIIALEGAHNGNSGLAVIAGTGSICFGKDSKGNIERTGGWGHLIGDDGSAYALGRDLFKECAKAIDGYGEATLLTNLLKNKMNLTDRTEIIKFVYSGDKATIASVAPLVDEAYALGDKVAQRIIHNNAYLLVETVCGVAKKLQMETSSIALFGGLIEKDTPLRKEFIAILQEVNPKLQCNKPIYNAAKGALMLAQKALDV